MALTFTKTEPVRFGDFEATPALTTSERMRIQNLKFDEANIAESIKQMAGAFGDYSDKVEEFMNQDMTIVQLQRLQAYLAGGEEMLKVVDEAMSQSVDKAFKEVK